MRLSLVAMRALPLCVGLAVCAAAGCGPTNSSLHGKVIYNGQPLKGGYVTFVPQSGGETFAAEIKEDGTYDVARITTGKYKVCVDTSNLKPQSQSYGSGGIGGKAAAKYKAPEGALPEGYKPSNPHLAQEARNSSRYVQIPPQYSSPDTTTLTVEVKSSGQTYDIPLS